MATGYPAILMLDGRLGIVIGGGVIGERKTRSLLDAGARVHVITQQATPGIRDLAAAGTITLTERAYAAGDLRGAAVVIASTDDTEVNHQIFLEASREGIPVNVVDDPPNSTFIAPSIIRRGDLLIAISTGGTSPALAVRLRERLEEEFGQQYADYLDLIRRLKDEEELPASQAERAAAWYRVVDSDVMELVASGKHDEAYERARALLHA
jgi:precorrin-2 dehydrogenase / sirohydrochlorin ferrochelatase